MPAAKFKATPAQLKLLENLQAGRPAGAGLSPSIAAAAESNCERNGLLRPWPFPGAGRLSAAGRAALKKRKPKER